MRPALAALVLLTVAGCEFGSVITVEGEGTTPRFVVKYDRGKPACVDSLEVSEFARDGTRRQLWVVARPYRSGAATCRDAFVYGRAPPSYEFGGGTPAPRNPLYCQRERRWLA